MSTSQCIRAALAAACWLAGAAVAQTNSVSIYVDDARPVAEAILSLTDNYPVVITYEDARYEYAGDLEDVTDAIRNPLGPPATRRVIVPRRHVLQASYDVPIETGRPDIAQALRNILAANDVGTAGGRFRVIDAGGVFHVVPAQVRDGRGVWVEQGSVLDTPISVLVDSVDGHALLEAVVAEINEAAGVRVLLNSQGFMNTFARNKSSVQADGEPARDVLLRSLHSISRGFTWRMFYSPSDKYYVLNLALAKGTVIEPPGATPRQLSAPRLGDPTPAGPPFRPRTEPPPRD
jgi:hypothetical protein